MRFKIGGALAGIACIAAIVSLFGVNRHSAAQADDKKVAEMIAEIKTAIANSKVPDEAKKQAAGPKGPVYGKIYYLWPMGNGTFLFGISTPTGGVAFTVKTGDLTADAMVKVLLMAYDKQVAVWVFEDPTKPQVAAGVVTVTP